MQESYQVRWFEKKVDMGNGYWGMVKTLQYRSKKDDGTWGEWADVETVTEDMPTKLPLKKATND